MRVLLLGTGGAFSKFGFGSSALIEGPDGPVLLDCPDSIHRALHEAVAIAGWSVDAAGIDDVLLTHLHGDHCNGLESLGFARMALRFEDASRCLPRVYACEPAARRIWERLAPSMDSLRHLDRPAREDDFFEVKAFEPKTEFAVAGLRVRSRYADHTIPTTGFLISDGSWTLGWSGDTVFDPAHIAWLEEADIIVHECSPPPIHTPVEALNGLPQVLRTKLRLIHLPDDFDPSTTDIQVLKAGDVLARP